MLVALDREDEHRFPQLSFLSALSVVESIQTAAEGAADVKIKWPNDVLLNVKKVSGILIEKEDAWAIIGIGINVNSSPGTKLVVYPTTSLANEKIAVSADELGKILANNLIRNMNELKNDGFKSIVARVKPFMYRMGEQIFITFRTGQISGVFEGLADTGGIIVDVGDDKITLLSGEMTKENFV
jgi:BirA family biotin operon repressor/biotin-[acetyl-CoA-carboxylase] ligase